jgi:YihY family inner membrane protein
VNALQRALGRFDTFQRSRPWLAFPVAVVKRFNDDRAGNLAALIAYYGFFSLFPLLLVLVSLLGIILRGDPGLRDSIVHSALAGFPVIGAQLKLKSLGGNGLALALGLATALWAGLGVTQAAQNAMNEVWGVPKKERPNFLYSRVRGLLLLAILGSMTLASIFLSGLGTVGGSLSGALRALGLVGSLGLNLGLFMLAFRVLTRRKLSWGDVFPGAAVGAVAWSALQAVGNYYVTHQVQHASPVYGTFAVVIGLLVWLYLGARLTLLCAEINVVRAKRLWPRSLLEPESVD